jgi:hypothetical protein
MKHSWHKVDYFNHVCINCGCEKELSKHQFPPTPSYYIDGKTFLVAPDCDGRIKKVKIQAIEPVLFP